MAGDFRWKRVGLIFCLHAHININNPTEETGPNVRNDRQACFLPEVKKEESKGNQRDLPLSEAKRPVKPIKM